MWFREDIASALMAAEQTSATTVAAVGNDVLDPAAMRAFRQGFQAALALAFGIEPDDISEEYRPARDEVLLTSSVAGTMPQSRPVCQLRTERRL